MRGMLAGAALLLSCLVAGCSPTAVSTGPATADADPGSRTSPSPSPSPTTPRPTKAQDAAALKKTLVTAADLGKPWIQPKSVAIVKGKRGEICPGHLSAQDKVAITARAGANLTEGKGPGKNIAVFIVATLPDEDESAVVAAYAKDQKACARYQDGSGMFVVRSADGPASVFGTTLISHWAERIYYDKAHTKLAYARHNLVARDGRVVTYLSYAFLTVKKDPHAKDFTRASRLLAVQLTKNAGQELS